MALRRIVDRAGDVQRAHGTAVVAAQRHGEAAVAYLHVLVRLAVALLARIVDRLADRAHAGRRELGERARLQLRQPVLERAFVPGAEDGAARRRTEGGMA